MTVDSGQLRVDSCGVALRRRIVGDGLARPE